MTDSEQATQASLQDLYEGARRDATYWNERWHASHFEHADERERLEARLAASEAERDSLRDKLAELVRFLEPLERDGGLNVPGLATLNRYRAALQSSEKGL